MTGAVAGVGLGATILTGISSADVAYSTYFVDGVAVRHYVPATPNGKPSIVMVHGGEHGAWVFEQYAPYFQGLGWDIHVLDWYNHGDSADQAMSLFIKRSILDVNREIQSVTRGLSAFHLLGHSMGGMAALFCGTFLNARSLVLISPVVPTQVGAATVPLSINLSELYPVPPFADAKAMFYQTMSDAEAQTHYARLQPESSQAVWEATRWTISLDLNAINAPTLCIGAGLDILVPPQYVQTLSSMLKHSEYVQYPVGHCDLLLKSSDWNVPASRILTFLNAH